MSKCGKCGAEVPEGTIFCGACGAPLAAGEAGGQDQFSQWLSGMVAMLARDPVVTLVGLGSLMLCVGSFLSWVSRSGPDILGLQVAAGPVVLALAVIMALAVLLARGGTPGAWGVVVLALSVVCLVLVFQEMIYLDDAHQSIGAGIYVAVAGGLVTAMGGLVETMRSLKK